MSNQQRYQRATHEPKSARLKDGFARDMLARRLGQDAADRIYAALPLYQRGPSKGQPKGQLCWEKVSVGGWSQFGVLRPGTDAIRIAKNIYCEGVMLRCIDQGNKPHYLINEEDRERETNRIVAALAHVQL